MATSEAQKKASAKYDKENVVGKYLKLNKNTDQDIIEFLKGKNLQTLFKKLVRDEIEREYENK
ncbi:hypothetical protein ACWG0P_07030 [Amedibacillus sp. YH-ame6]